MTYTLTLTPYLAAQLAACCLHAGLDTANLFAAYLTRHSEPPTPAATPAPATAQPELTLGYELPPPPPPAGAHGILARAAKLNQTKV